jgi:PRC-barrel domain protein
MDHPRPELKYVDAREMTGTAADLDGAIVEGADGEKLGVVEGFIVDIEQNRPRHVVVSAGWFIHKHFLLPIGHVTLSPDNAGLMADITKERVEGFPGFDKDEFEKFSGEELDQLDYSMASVAGGAEPAELDAHYRVPEGWESGPADLRF